MTHPLRVLVLGNFSAAPCGIRNFADMTLGGLAHTPGVSAVAWDATYDLVYARREAGLPTYLPPDAESYDVIHHNWHPIAFNTYGAGHFPWPKGTGPLLSVYLNDIPPWSGCPFIDRCEAVIAAEPTPVATHVMPYPIPDWVDHLPPVAQDFTVGWAGVRGDGADLLAEVCAARGWATNCNAPGEPWAPPEVEIRRRARSTVNVCWYHQARGIAGTPAMHLATRRPLLLNDSPMFAPWWAEPLYTGGLYLAHGHEGGPLEHTLERIRVDWQHGTLKHPSQLLYTDHGWSTQGPRLVAHWLDRLSRRSHV